MMNQSAVHSHTKTVSVIVPKTVKTSILVPVPTPAGIVAGVVEQETPSIVTEFHEVPMITLRIICKTFMPGGFCYLGVDERRPRILRPIYNIEPAKCCWDVNFVIGSVIEFQVIHHPDDPQPVNQTLLTAYPHRNEDLIVNKGTTAPVGPVPGCEWNPINILPLCKNSIFDIFSGLKNENQKYYVDENSPCQSAGMLLAEQKDVRFVHSNERMKVHIKNCAGPLLNMLNTELIFPYTALENIAMFKTTQNEYNGKFIVVLGLARPYEGTILGSPFNPRRCYVLVVGILGFSMPIQQ